jgi:hypothetical protein
MIFFKIFLLFTCSLHRKVAAYLAAEGKMERERQKIRTGYLKQPQNHPGFDQLIFSFICQGLLIPVGGC